MQLISALVVIFWWIAIWGLFDTYTENKSQEEKIQIYLIMLGLITVIICFFPHILKKF
jgi:hypothetical protein